MGDIFAGTSRLGVVGAVAAAVGRGLGIRGGSKITSPGCPVDALASFAVTFWCCGDGTPAPLVEEMPRAGERVFDEEADGDRAAPANMVVLAGPGTGGVGSSRAFPLPLLCVCGVMGGLDISVGRGTTTRSTCSGLADSFKLFGVLGTGGTGGVAASFVRSKVLVDAPAGVSVPVRTRRNPNPCFCLPPSDMVLGIRRRRRRSSDCERLCE